MSEFDIKMVDQLFVSTSSVSPVEDKLAIGGQYSTTSSYFLAGYSSLAQVNLESGSVDFVRSFKARSAVTAVAYQQTTDGDGNERVEISALISPCDERNGNSIHYIWTLSQAGEALKRPIIVILPNLKSAAESARPHAQLSFTQSGQGVLAVSPAELGREKMSIFLFDSDFETISDEISIEGFKLSNGL